MNLRLGEIYSLFGADKYAPAKDAEVAGISTDSRKTKKGEVFIAIKGDTMDGHKFVEDALAKGALVAVVEKGRPGARGRIVVEDTKAAIMELGKYYFTKFKGLRVAAVTGSNGKTTTKEILGAMLAQKYCVKKNEKSFNNYLGLPLTIFGIEKGHQVLVAEIGMNHKGEIKGLASLIKIDAAIITNIGRAHIGNFKDINGIAAAKSEIFGGVREGGCACLNADDKFYTFLKNRAGKIRTVSFGVKAKADYTAKFIRETGGMTEFELAVPGKKMLMKTHMRGAHNLSNIAAAAAAASALGVTPAQIKEALAGFKMQGLMRFEEKDINGIKVINDMYNANPDSFAASLKTLASLNYKNLIVISGDMLELGKNSAAFHEEIGGKIGGLKLKKLLIYGKFGKSVKKGFVAEAGKNAAQTAAVFRDKEALKKELRAVAGKGDVVFIKGSRGNKLEEVLSALERE